MKLMLAFIFFCVLLGLVSARFGGRQHATVAGFAVVMTWLYLFFERFM